jgi:N utilization substance protein A
MNSDLLRIVEALHREKGIDKETIFRDIEAALAVAARRRFPHAERIEIHIDRKTGQIQATCEGRPFSPEILGRIAAQTYKQVYIQRIREAEREAIYKEFADKVGELVHGTVQRVEREVVTVNLGKVEAILPKTEQIPKDHFRVGDRLRAVIREVRKVNGRVKIVLSRTHPDFIRRLFEREIPEVADRVIEIKGVVREPGQRAKVAVVSSDSRVDCVGACVGIRGARIKNILDELSGEKIDIVRWNESPQVLIASALQPAEVEEVILFPALSRAIVLVREDQLSQAIGSRGQNVRLASRLTGWEIEIMTAQELEDEARRAMVRFSALPEVDADLADKMIEQGLLSYADLASLEAEELAQLVGIPVEKAAAIIDVAARKARLGEDPAANLALEPELPSPAAELGPPQQPAGSAEAHALEAAAEERRVEETEGRSIAPESRAEGGSSPAIPGVSGEAGQPVSRERADGPLLVDSEAASAERSPTDTAAPIGGEVTEVADRHPGA